jgi:hypothetical protein
MTQNDMSRSMYVALRKSTGSPPMTAIKLFENTWYIETKKGEVMFEQKMGESTIWDAKSAGVLEWSERHGERKGL